MARWEFTLPDIGEGVAEGEIVTWFVRPGEQVSEDQAVVEVMTDKATVTITAPRAGVVVETRGTVGQIIPVHSVLVVFELDSAHASLPGTPRDERPHAAERGTNGRMPAPEPAATAVGELKESLPGLETAVSGGGGAPTVLVGPAASRGYVNERPLATPATRRFAREMHVDLRRVPAHGPKGRITRQDVEEFARSLRSEGAQAMPPAAPAAAEPRRRAEDRIPFTGLRRRIAQRMAQSTSTAAHFTFVEECDVSELKALRGRLNVATAAMGVKLSFLPFIVKAVVASLKKHPMLNATLDEEKGEIVLRKYYNVGIATATTPGLIVPVVKDADRRGLVDMAREIDRLANDARTGQAKLEDLTGSTFTITSLGAHGGLLATPIINFPEVAILGVHQIKRKPIVKGDAIVIGDVMVLSLSFDHRIVDGHVGAAFAYDVIGYLERPETLLLEMT